MNMLNIQRMTGWLTDWSKDGGRHSFKEWVRSIHLTALNHGYFYALRTEPGHWWDGLRNVISWAPTLFFDREWDYSYLLVMMQEKLKRMRQHHMEHSYHTSHMEVAREIKSLEVVVARILNDDYLSKEWAEHRRRFKTYKRWNTDKWEETSEGHRIIPPSGPAENKDSKRLYAIEEKTRQDDLDLMGRIMAKNLRQWWCTFAICILPAVASY